MDHDLKVWGMIKSGTLFHKQIPPSALRRGESIYTSAGLNSLSSNNLMEAILPLRASVRFDQPWCLLQRTLSKISISQDKKSVKPCRDWQNSEEK